MTNILLIFLNDISRTEEFNEIIDKFAERNYAMYLLENIKDDEYFSMDSLPELVKLYKEQHDDVNKVVVLSNARDLMFSWYRCYNSLVDDFIYFVDEDEKNYYDIDDRHYTFYKYLSQFSGIEEETIYGKIYVNIDFNNYEKIMEFLTQNNNFKYFNNLDEYNFNKNIIDKTNKSKRYISNKYEYNFGASGTKDVQIINMLNINKKSLEINDKLLQDMLDNIYIIPYITVLLYRTKGQVANNLLVMNYKGLKEVDKQHQKNIFERLFTYISNNNYDFKEKIYISSLLVMINNGDERLAEFILKTLLEDEEYIEYHYGVLFNILFYKTNDNLEISDRVYVEIRKEVIKLGKYFKKQTDINMSNVKDDSDNLRIAVHSDQLLSINHAPTIIALNIAKNLKGYHKDIEVKIFIEDNFKMNLDEVKFPYSYTSTKSLECSKIHEDYLKGYNIEIYYSNPSNSKIQRTKEIVEEINKFNPSVIYSTSDISIAREILYPYYPIVYQTNGGTNFSTLCDAYVLYGDSQKHNLLKINNNIKLIDEDKIFVNKKPATIRKQLKNDYQKSDFGIGLKSFVMITVGNRLGAELKENFIDMICSFIKQEKEVYWIIVGTNDIFYINNKYRELLDQGKIITIGYEEDLLSIYKICDVYINPKRNGGAGSVSIAMQAGIPSIVDKTSQDSIFVIGEENCVEDDKEKYMEELLKLYKDSEYRRYKGKLMKEIVAGRGNWKEHIKNYIGIFNIAKKNYNKRNF